MSEIMSEINFANGQPNDAILPQELVLEAAQKIFHPSAHESSSHALNYGDAPSNFRNSLATFLSNSALCGNGQERVNPELIVPTTGVSHGLDMICTMLCKKHVVQRCSSSSGGGGEEVAGSHFVWVEDTTYYLASSIFKDYGLQVRTVRTDSEGIVTQDLERQLQQLQQEREEQQEQQQQQEKEKDERVSSRGTGGGAAGTGAVSSPQPLFLYTIPLFNNPTGRCISASRKQQLLTLTRKHGLMVVSDEVYQMLDSSNHLTLLSSSPCPPPPPLSPLRSLLSLLDMPSPHTQKEQQHQQEQQEEQEVQPPENVLVVSSFSKILAPGLRLGWIQCSTEQQARDLWGLGFMRSGSSPCHFAACLVAHLLQPLPPPLDTETEAETGGSSVSGDSGSGGSGGGGGDAVPFRCLLDAQVSSLCRQYARKYETLTAALQEHSTRLLAGGAGGALHVEGFRHGDRDRDRVRPRVGGYFVWVRLPPWCHAGLPGAAAGADPSTSPPPSPSRPSCCSFLQAAEAALLTVRSGQECTGNCSGNEDCIRLCFARLEDEELREGARRLCQLLADLYQQHQQHHQH